MGLRSADIPHQLPHPVTEPRLQATVSEGEAEVVQGPYPPLTAPHQVGEQVPVSAIDGEEGQGPYLLLAEVNAVVNACLVCLHEQGG
jgi:hypothetical protein